LAIGKELQQVAIAKLLAEDDAWLGLELFSGKIKGLRRIGYGYGAQIFNIPEWLLLEFGPTSAEMFWQVSGSITRV
jgi:hypothetical protein